MNRLLRFKRPDANVNCTGTGMENPARYNRFIAKDYDRTIYINLFIPSAFTTEDGWKIAIETKFPYEQSAQIKILSEGKNPRSLKIRTPLWTEDARTADGYELKSEKISAGETYSVNLPMNLHTRRTRDRRLSSFMERVREYSVRPSSMN